MEKQKTYKCCICGNEFVGFGNNPYPLCHKDDYESRCCDECDNLVINARMWRLIHKVSDDKVVQEKFLGKVCEPKC